MNFVAVDLGGTRLKAGRMAHGESVPSDVFTLEHEGDWRGGLQAVLDHFGDVGELAVCVPGLVDQGRVIALPGKLPGIEGQELRAVLGMPALVTNDALAYGVGEAVHGAGRGHERVVVVTIGTGVGVAVIEDGAPLGRGPFGGGILGGQIRIANDDEGPTDTSGRSGTFEALCRASSLVSLVPGADDVSEAYALVHTVNEQVAKGFFEYRERLVRGLTALALAHAPSAIVIGGGAARPVLLAGVEQGIAAGLWRGQRVEVRLAELGDAAALAGLGVLWRRAES